MKYLQLLFVFLFICTVEAIGSCPLDVGKFTRFLQDGNIAGARQMIFEMASDPACRCATRDVACIRLGPEGSDTLSVNQFTSGLDSLERFEKELTETCDGLPEKDRPQWDGKLACYQKKLKEHQTRAPGTSGQFFSDLADKMTSRHSESVQNKIEAEKEAKLKAERESLPYRNKVRAEKITKDICSLYKEKKIQSERLENVARHSGWDRNAREKLIKIEYQVKNLDIRIEKLKMEYQAVSDKSFFLFEWCEDEKQERK